VDRLEHSLTVLHVAVRQPSLVTLTTMSEPDLDKQLKSARKKRGQAKASITRLSKNITDLVGEEADAKTLGLARQAAKRLRALDAEYRQHHTSLIDLIDDEEALAKEQEDLDTHDDGVSLLTVEIELIIAACSSSSPSSSPRKAVERRLSHLKKAMAQAQKDIGTLAGKPDDPCLVEHHGERIVDIKKQLQDITTSALLVKR